MAIINKAAIQALIDAYDAKILLYITSNNNKDITGAQLKEILDESSVILEQIKDSYFNLINEPRTALSTTYSPLDALNWDALPAEVKAALDELAERLRIFEDVTYSTAVAWVDENSVLVPQLGNPFKPFATILDALNAVGNDGKVIVNPGTYSGFSLFSMQNVTIDLRGSILTNGIFCPNGSGLTFLLSKTQITGNVRIDGAKVEGGIITGELSFVNSVVEDTVSNSASFGISLCENSILTNVTVVSVNDAIKSAKNSRFYGCKATATGVNAAAYRNGNLGGPLNKFYNCELKSDQYISLFYNTPNFAIMMWNCRIHSLTSNNLRISTVTEGIYFKGCVFITDGIPPNVSAESLNNTTIQQPTFEECRFITQGAGVLDEGTYAVGDLTEFVFTNCTINTATITSAVAQKVDEFNTRVKLDLTDIN